MPSDHALFAPDFKPAPYWWDAAEPSSRHTSIPSACAVAIVGGGYAGLSAALTLRRLGHEVVVLDAERIGWGASSRNGGMVSGSLKVGPAALSKRFGDVQALAMREAAAAAFPFIEDLIAREGIACDYVRCGRFLAAWTPAHYRALERKTEEVAQDSGMPARMVPREHQRDELASDHYHGGMVAEATGSLHPGRYVRGLAEAAARAGATLVDGTRVEAIGPDGSGFVLKTSLGPLRAGAVLVTLNGYAKPAAGAGPMPWLARRMIPVASYIIATAPLGTERVRALFPKLRMVSDTKRVLNYFRPSPDGQRVLWGGRASFRLGTTAQEAAPVLHRMMTDVFPELRGTAITHAWTGNVAFTLDGLPHIGVHDGLHFAGGCQGSGVAMATWLGHQAALKLAGAANAGFALDQTRFPALPLYDGRPWFLPAVGRWFALRDRIDRLAA